MNKEIEALKELHSDKIKSIDLLRKANSVLGPGAIILSWSAIVVTNHPELALLFGGAITTTLMNEIRLEKLTSRADEQYGTVRKALGKRQLHK